jgi:hypothetical protein
MGNKQIIDHLRGEKKRVLNQRIIGSDDMTIDMLLGTEGFLIPFTWLYQRKSIDKDLIIYLADTMISNEIFDNYIVLADPGIGKSTLMQIVYLKIIDMYIQRKTKSIPLLVDLHRVKGESDVGSEAWISSYLLKFFPFLTEDFCRSFRNNFIFLLDGLDEFLAGFNYSEIVNVLSRALFVDSVHVLTCRQGFYEKHLFSIDDIHRNHKTIYLKKWSNASRLEYAEKYLRMYQLEENKAFEIIDCLKKSEFLQETTRTPLYMIIVLEVMINSDESHLDNLLSWYRRFTQLWINREIIKARASFDPEEINNIVKAIAWHFFDEDNEDSTTYIKFNSNALRSFIDKNNESSYSTVELLDFLLNRTFLLSSTDSGIKFLHKSFQEFYVSHYIFDCLTSDADKLSKSLQTNYIFAVVSEFTKEFLKTTNGNKDIQKKILANCCQALDTNNIMYGDNYDTVVRKRMARQQLTYYIGNLIIPEASNFLTDYLKREMDLWIKRGILIGLSLGGREYKLNEYLERLYEEINEGGFCPENEVNIGYSLSFFGDQPFNILQIDIDQGYASCENTVKRLVYQLTTVIDQGCWRSNLYTLLYLSKYRNISQYEFYVTFYGLKDVISEILAKLEKDPERRWWPEIDEMKQLISKADWLCGIAICLDSKNLTSTGKELKNE